MKLLLTGFEPFGGRSVNASQRVMQSLGGLAVVGVELHTALLPVEHERGPAALLGAFHDVQPDAVICLGEAGRRVRLSIERVAVNLLDYPLADNAGQQIVDQPIVPDGPAAYFVTLPVRAMLSAITAADIPAELSLSAGTFLCNQVTYVLLHYLAVHQMPCLAGFIHLPFLPEQTVRETTPIPSMSLETMRQGLIAAIGVLVEADRHRQSSG